MIILAYAGYLVRIMGATNYDIPLNYIQKESYKCTFSTLDKEAFRDGDGVLHRIRIVLVIKQPYIHAVSILLHNPCTDSFAGSRL